MSPKKTCGLQEAELRSLLATPAGRGELEALASRYAAAVGRLLPGLGPLVTYIVLYEQERSLIDA